MSNLHDNNIKQQKIRQSNNLVESPYTQEFSPHEIKVFEIAAAGITSTDIDKVSTFSNKKYFFSSSQLACLLNTSVSVISHEIEKTAARIMKKNIHLRKVLEDGSIEFEIINIIPYARYKNGILELDLNYVLIPYLAEVNKNFTEYQLHYLLLLNSAYAIKLYKLLYQYKNIKKRIFFIDELKEQFGIIDKYSQYKDFKKRIITPSIEQINEFTDLKVYLNEIKIGRAVSKIEFIFEVKSTKSLESKHSDEIIDIANNIVASNLNEGLETELSSQTKSLITQYQQEKGLEYVDASISYAKKNAKTNFDKYLADTLTKGWAEVEIKKQTIKKKQVVEKVTATKEANLKKEQDKERDRLSKSIVENKWNELLDEDKAYHVDYANSILNRYTEKLSSFSTAKQYLSLCIYAVSNQTSYDRALESYMKHVLNVSLNISDSTL